MTFSPALTVKGFGQQLARALWLKLEFELGGVETENLQRSSMKMAPCITGLQYMVCILQHFVFDLEN